MHGPDDLPGAVYMLFPMLSGNSCLVHMHGPDDLPGTLYMLFPMLSGNSVAIVHIQAWSRCCSGKLCICYFQC